MWKELSQNPDRFIAILNPFLDTPTTSWYLWTYIIDKGWVIAWCISSQWAVDWIILDSNWPKMDQKWEEPQKNGRKVKEFDDIEIYTTLF